MIKSQRTVTGPRIDVFSNRVIDSPTPVTPSLTDGAATVTFALTGTVLCDIDFVSTNNSTRKINFALWWPLLDYTIL